MKRIVALCLLVFVVTAAIVVTLRLRMQEAADDAPILPESLPPAPDLDSIPGDSVYFGEIMETRKAAEDFLRGDESPLDEKDRLQFKGLNYYPPDPAWRFRVRLEPPAVGDTVELLDTTGAERRFVRHGVLKFRFGDQEETLTLFREPLQNYLFLPFKDATAGKETYEVGRYVEPIEAEPGLFLVDFNRAYNPYCAYSHRWSCPIPPEENELSVAIRAGEKKFHAEPADVR